MKFFPCKSSSGLEGFTLSELMVAVVIVGVLASVALPSYNYQLVRSRQDEVTGIISGISSAFTAYGDEFGVPPSGWSDLQEIQPVLTTTGVATGTDFTNKVTLAGGFYDLQISQSNNGQFIFESNTLNASNLNVVACLNLANGVNIINEGTSEAKAPSTPTC
ncbi:MAG: type IV pilin protein [Synechococcus sp.]